MATEFKVPDLGENIEEGQVVSVLVSKGDSISKDQPVLELETGKATIEVPSDVEGTVRDISVGEGDTVKVGQAVITLDEGEGGGGESGEAGEQPAEEKEEAAPPKEEPAEEKAPAESEKEEAAEQPAAAEAPAQKQPAPAQPAQPAPAAAPPKGDRVPVRAAPSVRKFAREIGVAIEDVSPLEGDRITFDAVKAHAKHLLQQGPAAGGGGGVAAPPLPDFSTWGDIEREKMTTIRQMTAKHMAACWSTIPHVTQHDTVDITSLEDFRKRYGKKAEREGVKVTVTAILLKIVANALRAHPRMAASIDVQSNEIIYKKYTHIGVAVDTPKGLLVPVIRDVDAKSVIDLARELKESAEKARQGKTAPEEMQGGCFTITNLGGIGGEHFTPIVNYPEAAILGVGRASTQPVWEQGQWQPRLMMPLSLSYDHRLIDGADGARFIRWINDAISEPLLIALEG